MWWVSKTTDDEKYVLIEDKMETFQNTISKVQSDIKNLKCEKDSLIVVVANLRKDFEKQKLINEEVSEELRNDVYDLSKDEVENDILVIKSDIESLKRKTDDVAVQTDGSTIISPEVYLNPYDLLTHTETMNLDDFLSEPMDIIAEENTIQIGGSLTRKSERIKSKNLKNKKRNNNKKQWKA